MFTTQNVELRLERDSMPIPECGCIVWLGEITRGGYGLISVRGKSRAVHRVAYERANGPIPAGLKLDHLCRVRSCINPAHLEPVTQRENILRGIGLAAINAKKTHCKRGHEFTADNTKINLVGARICKTCERAKWRANNAKRRR